MLFNRSENIEEAMILFSLQNRVPIWSEYSTLNETRIFRQDQGVYDTRPETVFTIGKPEDKFVSFGLNVLKMSLNGNIRIGVHVTDISRIVQKDHDLDEEAKEKGFSFHSGYPDTRHTLFPEQIQTICCLAEGQRRHTLSVYVDINNDGKVIHEPLSKTISQSSRHYTYSEAELIIENIHTSDFGDSDIQILHAPSEKLQKKRMGAAALSIDTKMDFSSVESFMTTIKSRNMVDEILTLANQTVGKLLQNTFPMNIPIYTTIPVKIDSERKKMVQKK